MYKPNPKPNQEANQPTNPKPNQTANKKEPHKPTNQT